MDGFEWGRNRDVLRTIGEQGLQAVVDRWIEPRQPQYPTPGYGSVQVGDDRSRVDQLYTILTGKDRVSVAGSGYDDYGLLDALVPAYHEI